MQDLWKPERVPGEVELAIWRAGEGDETLVCLHGISQHHRAFTALARQLQDIYELVGVDLRGRGDSEKPEDGYGLKVHAGNVVRLLEHLDLERAVLIGHSMGAFVGLQVALSYPNRVKALVLVDGGSPRVEKSAEEMTEKERQEEEAIEEGLERAFSRLEMVFETPDDYLNFWFPDQDLTMEELPPDLADYYRYDLGKVEGGYQPKASLGAVRVDASDVSDHALTAEEMRSVRCPATLNRPTAGFFPESDPLISEERRAAMTDALDLRSDTVLEGANHYTMLWAEHSQQVAEAIHSFLTEIE